MLWCKETFEQHFDKSECRLFPVQQQLFDFVDEAASSQRTNGVFHGHPWMCFSIEFPSASEVSRLLSRHTASPKGGVPLFQATSTCALASPEANGSDSSALRPSSSSSTSRKRPREDFGLLYGDAPLSQQNRMFLAVTQSGLGSLLSTIEPRQLHLYEILREGTPCHLYFDVEREGNHTAVRHAVSVDEDSNTSSVTEDDAIVVVEEEDAVTPGRRLTTFQAAMARYQLLCRRASCAPAAAVCGLDCTVEPDNSNTCDMLLAHVEAFVRERFPSLLPLPQQQGAEENSVFKEVWVLQSIPLSGVATKFSQHYILKFHDSVFDSTNSVKEFVRQFVAYLSHRAVHDSVIHRSLFFHGPPVWHVVFRTLFSDYPRNALPYLPRKCVIDEAVYTKNRMMRCLGSCKLGKTSVLCLHRYYAGGTCVAAYDTPSSFATPSLKLVLDTMIAVRDSTGEATRTFHLQGGPATSEERQDTLHRTRPLNTEAASWELLADTEKDGVAGIAALLEKLYSRIARAECTLSRPRKIQGRFLTFQVSGTRYCQHVGREHKSNNVYLVVDLEKRTFVQKCFDPDCQTYRSQALSLDCDALPPR